MMHPRPRPLFVPLTLQGLLLGGPLWFATHLGWMNPTLCVFAIGGLHLVWAALESRLVPDPPPDLANGPSDLAAWMGLALLCQFWIASLFSSDWLFGIGRFSYLGLLLFGTGIGLRCLAICHLGDFFLSPIALRADHQLVTQGVYRWLKHPSEWGLWLIAFGTGLAFHSAFALVFALLTVIPLSLRRMRLEDQMLAQAFPLDFAAYRATGRWFTKRGISSH